MGSQTTVETTAPLSLAKKGVLPVFVLAACAVLLAACVTRFLTGHPPQVSLHTLAREGQVITVDLNLRNINDEALELSRMELHLELDDQLLLQTDQALQLTMPAGGRERVRAEVVGGLAGLEVLDTLDGDQHDSRPWLLQGRLFDDRGRALQVEAKGWLYPVPGKPGQYR